MNWYREWIHLCWWWGRTENYLVEDLSEQLGMLLNWWVVGVDRGIRRIQGSRLVRGRVSVWHSTSPTTLSGRRLSTSPQRSGFHHHTIWRVGSVSWWVPSCYPSSPAGTQHTSMRYPSRIVWRCPTRLSTAGWLLATHSTTWMMDLDPGYQLLSCWCTH